MSKLGFSTFKFTYIAPLPTLTMMRPRIIYTYVSKTHNSKLKLQ
jgi:hypothetical protein